MKFKMKVKDFFRIGNKTIFVGDLISEEKNISNATCFIKIGESIQGEIRIDGEVSNGTGHRDLWTSSPMSLDHAILLERDVWLIAM